MWRGQHIESAEVLWEGAASHLGRAAQTAIELYAEGGTLSAGGFCEGRHIESSEELEGKSVRRGGRTSGRGGM